MQTFTDIYKYRFVLSTLVEKNLKIMYRSMSLGLLWALLNPLVMVTTLSVVWTQFMPVPPGFTGMVIVALIPYNFCNYCINGCASAIHGNISLVKRVGFPRQILPVSVVLTHLIHFGIQLTLVAAVLAIPALAPATAQWGFHLLWLVPIFIVQLGFCVGIGLLVSALNVIYRDVQYIIESGLTVLFWFCPILYDPYASNVDGRPTLFEKYPAATYIYHSNPVSAILTCYQDVLCRGHAPRMEVFGLAFLSTLVVGYLGVRIFWKHEREFADLI